MIERGEKTEEYREIKPYYIPGFLKIGSAAKLLRGRCSMSLFRIFVIVVTSNRRRMILACG